MGVQGIAPPGAERAFVADPDVVLVGTWPGAPEAVTSIRCSRSCAPCARGGSWCMPNRAAGGALAVHGRRLSGSSARAPASRIACRRARDSGRDDAGAPRSSPGPRRALLVLALLLAIGRGQRVAAPRLGAVALARELGLPAWRVRARRHRRGDLLERAPAARAARRARGRRPGRRGRHAAGGLPQPDGRLGPARRRRRRGAGRRARRAPRDGGARLPGAAARRLRGRAGGDPGRLPLADARDAPSLHGLLLTGIAVSALASAGTSVLLVATEEFRVKTVLFWLAGGLEGRGWTHVQLGAAFVLPGVALLVLLAGRSTCCRWARMRPRPSACRCTRRAWCSSPWPRSWRGPRRRSRARSRSSA